MLNAFNAFLERSVCAHTPKGQLQEAMLYSVLAGGKRVRPMLCVLSAQLFDNAIKEDTLYPVAAALEFVHCYSLIHDDLPAMDDDDLRRGKPTLHKAYDEATAILVGDALQSLAFTLLSDPDFSINDAIKMQLIYILSKAIGPSGMVLGQYHDMGCDPTHALNRPEKIMAMHAQKTGTLIKAACQMGTLMTGIQQSDVRYTQITEIGALIGLIFQLQDDVLDATQSSIILGKTAGKDATDHKPSMLSLLSLTEAEALLEEKYQQLFLLLKDIDGISQTMHTYIKQLQQRIM